MNKETRQIKEAFIDGYLSAMGHDADVYYVGEAEQAWRDENTTHLRPPPKPPRRLTQPWEGQ